jgi:hypothetical protein
MRVVFNDLELERLWVVYPGEKSYPLDDGIDASSSRVLQVCAGGAYAEGVERQFRVGLAGK